MAHVEIVAVGNGEKSKILNVTDAVGPSWGIEEDVMLVKTLLEVPLYSWGVNPGTQHLVMVGTLDEKTKANIKIFQTKFNEYTKGFGSPERLTVDGRVSRARGQVSWDKNRPWTIAKMNAVTSYFVRMQGVKSVAQYVLMRNPYLAGIMDLDWGDV